MTYGICDLSMVAVRKQAGDTHEMVNQLLFGDILLVKDQLAGWLLIETLDDAYEGWVDAKQIVEIDEDVFTSMQYMPRFYLMQAFGKAISESSERLLSFGSLLPFYQSEKFQILKDQYQISAEVIQATTEVNAEHLIATAKHMLGTPYLWGGRSIMGIDCSGFIQLVFKLNGCLLPRDSSQQVDHGETISFVNEALPGDLAFFDNDEGNITHVGMILEGGKIIHASGKVRIDTLDHQGIFNVDTQQYSHKLRIIKRLLSH